MRFSSCVATYHIPHDAPTLSAGNACFRVIACDMKGFTAPLVHAKEAPMRLPLLPRYFSLVVIAALLAALPDHAYAQAGTSGLTGVVTDPSGTPMDRVHIVVLDPLTGFS